MNKKLDFAIKEQDFYQAHQLWISYSQRLINKQLYSDAVVLLKNGASTLINQNHPSSAYDLILRILKLPLSDSTFIRDLALAYPISDKLHNDLIVKIIKYEYVDLLYSCVLGYN